MEGLQRRTVIHMALLLLTVLEVLSHYSQQQDDFFFPSLTLFTCSDYLPVRVFPTLRYLQNR
jgi:hypothetical protein